MSTDGALAIVLIYPDLLGTYGDRGNALALAFRSRARGLPARIVEVAVGEHLPRTGDVYLVGGSEDTAQALAWRSLLAEPHVEDLLHDAPACLAVCAGFQLLARAFTGVDGRDQPGLGLLDVTCGRLPHSRAVGEVLCEPVGLPDVGPLTGYENHQGDAVLGPAARPLGHVVRGTGNGHAAVEGAVQDGVVATYLHGPVLVRNPALADHLLERSTGPLPAFDDDAVARLRAERIAAAGQPRAGRLRRRGAGTAAGWPPWRRR
jgi:lipid II isoglutaminyl synthase (glutamine-hydrolysing)